MNKTYTEIMDQYEALAFTADYIDARLPEIATLFQGCDQYVFIGCGSSYAVAESGALIARLRMEKPATAIAAGDLLLHADTYRPVLKNSLLVVLSRSGETSEAIRAVDLVRTMGLDCKVLGVACVEESTLAMRSDAILEMPWAFDHSVCQTRTVSCLYLFCAYSIAKLVGDETLVMDLRTAIAGGPEFISSIEAALKAVAKGDWTHTVVLGDAELGGLCEEGALAFKEICQLPSNHHHLLDVRHGPMVLIGKRTLVIAVLSEPNNRLELDVLHDIAAKGATVVAYSDEPLDAPGIINVCFGQKLRHSARGIPAIAVCQLISYHKSFQTGADPDRPDGLSPWIALS